MKFKTLTTIGVTAGLAAPLLLAQDGGRLKEMDKNGDGKLSQDEVPAEAWTRLSKLDANGDGAVTPDEMAKARPPGGGPGGPGGPGRGEFFKAADKNGDGKITQDEAGERWERMSKADKDGDGAVTPQELMAAMGGPGGPGGAGRPDGKEMFARMDKNADGKIGQDEVPAELWTRLSKADANGDGAVTPEEMKAAGPGAGPGGPGGQGGGAVPKRPPVES